jgi:molybdenum cofactor cytidylyltransferase
VTNGKIAAVILAAGASKRMGRPKMLLPWGKTTVLGQVIETMAEALAQNIPTPGNVGVQEAREILVVTGGARGEVEGLVSGLAGKFAVRCVHNPAYEAGEMLSSLQRGLAALGPEVESALVGLGDQPQVSLSAARKVVSAFESPGARLIIPSFNMRRGHPWLVERSLWAEILAMQPPQKLRDFLNAHAGEICYVETDASILKDLDTPEQYSREKP